MSEGNSRREFLKTALVAAGGITALFANVKFNASDGVKIGQTIIRVGMSEAHATCGSSYTCGGGGGQCGSSYSCSGGDGQCGSSYGCGGGGGQCGSSYTCGGGGGVCGSSYDCSGW